MCFVVTTAGDIVNANAVSIATLGYPLEALKRMQFARLLEDSWIFKFESAASVVSGAGGRESFEASLVTSEGMLVNAVLYVAQCPSLGDGCASQLFVIARNISEVKKKELDLLRFSNISHYTVNPLEITDVEGRIIYVNPAFEKASGYSKEELLGKNPRIFGSGKHSKGFWDGMWRTIRAGKVWVGEVENRRRNGEPFFAQLLVSPIIDAAGLIVGYFGVHRDIGEQKQLEQQLIHAQKMESIGLLAAGVAHEVGNPLTSISSLVQIIQRETTDAFTHEKLNLIKSQITRISRIIRDLVNFSRRSSYELQMTDVNKCLREALEIVRVGKRAREVEFRQELSDAIPPLLLVPDQIEQVFINILINAVDAIHAGKESEPSKGLVRVSTSLEHDTLVIVIEDDGKGIAEEAIPKIFEPFYTTKRVGEGTGLGLWVSFGIVKSFHGSIEVKSTEGAGTSMLIRLPLRP
jgi:PAS domain S-box-containing protein